MARSAWLGFSPRRCKFQVQTTDLSVLQSPSSILLPPKKNKNKTHTHSHLQTTLTTVSDLLMFSIISKIKDILEFRQTWVLVLMLINFDKIHPRTVLDKVAVMPRAPHGCFLFSLTSFDQILVCSILRVTSVLRVSWMVCFISITVQ